MDRNDYYNDEDKYNDNLEEDISEAEQQSTLPSRVEVHRQNREKSTPKVKYPVIKILAFFFILFPVVLYGWFTFFADSDKGSNGKGDNDSFEKIDMNKDNDKGKGTILDINNNGSKNDDGPENTDPSKDEEGNRDNDQVEKPDDNKGNEQQDRPNPPVNNNPPPEVNNNNNVEPEQPPVTEKVVNHTVQKSENLYRISLKYFKSSDGVEIIKKANNLPSDNIQVGQVLKIPLPN